MVCYSACPHSCSVFVRVSDPNRRQYWVDIAKQRNVVAEISGGLAISTDSSFDLDYLGEQRITSQIFRVCNSIIIRVGQRVKDYEHEINLPGSVIECEAQIQSKTASIRSEVEFNRTILTIFQDVFDELRCFEFQDL